MEIQRFKGSKNSNNSDAIHVWLLGRLTLVSSCRAPVLYLDTVVLFRTAVLSNAKNTPGFNVGRMWLRFVRENEVESNAYLGMEG